MIESFLKSLGATPSEYNRVWLLLGMGFFTGIFLAAYQVGVEVVFLKTPGLGDAHLDKAMFAAGGFGLISTFIFVYLQSRIPYARLAVGNLLFFVIFLTIIAILFETQGVGPSSQYQIKAFYGKTELDINKLKQDGSDYFITAKQGLSTKTSSNVIDSVLIQSKEQLAELGSDLPSYNQELVRNSITSLETLGESQDENGVSDAIDEASAAWIPEVSAFYLGIVFLSFMMLGPIMATILLGFWGTFNRLFSLRESKRIIGGIDTGQLTATILAFFAIGALPDVFRSADLIGVSAVCVTGSMVFMIIITRRYDLDAMMMAKVGEEKIRSKYADLFTNKYLKWLCLFLLLSMIATVFMDYSFLTTINIYYPIESQLQQYISFFSAVVMIVSFIIQTWVNDIIIGKYGLKVSLLVMPAILGLFVIGAIAGGLFYGYEVKNEQFLYFFMFVSMGKLFSAAFKDALENPAFKLYFLPLDIRIRFDIQTKIEGVINELSSLLAGVLLVLLGLDFFGFKLISYLVIILAVVVGMYFAAIRLYREYRASLHSALERNKKTQVQKTEVEKSIIKLLEKELTSSDPAKVIFAAKLLEKVEPVRLENTLSKLLKSKSPEIREYAVKRVEQLRSFSLVDAVREQIEVEQAPNVKALAQDAVQRLAETDTIKVSPEKIKKLVRSTTSQDRVFAAKLLPQTPEDVYLPYITELLRDINPKVRIAAFMAAGQIKHSEFWPFLIDNLPSPTYSNAASAALVAIGEPILPSLESAFNKTGQKSHVRVRIIQIFGRIGGKEAEELLWKKIDSTDRSVFTQVLLSLKEIGYKARDFQAARIKITIESDIEDVAWNIQALHALQESEEDELLTLALEEENKHNYEHIYMLLSMNYDPQSIQLVKENIESGFDDNVTYALELLDVFLTEDLKPKLSPILDNVSYEDRMKRLDDYYPRESFENLEEVYLKIVNRDYNHINRWTKALALYRLGQLPEATPSADLVANLFNPDPLLRETAAWALREIDQNVYKENSWRLPRNIKRELDRIVYPAFAVQEGGGREKMLQIQRIMFIIEMEEFAMIPREVVAELSDFVEEKFVKKSQILVQQGESGDTPIYVVVTGKLEEKDGDKIIRNVENKELIGEMNVLDTDLNAFTYTAAEDTLVYSINKDKFYELMSKNPEMTNGVVSLMNKRFSSGKMEETA